MPTATAAPMTGGAIVGIVILAFAGALFLGGWVGLLLAHRIDRVAVATATTGQTKAEAARDAARLDRDNALLTAHDLRGQVQTANLATANAERALDTSRQHYAELYRRFAREMANYGVNIDGGSLSPHPSPITDPRGFTEWWRSLTGAQ